MVSESISRRRRLLLFNSFILSVRSKPLCFCWCFSASFSRLPHTCFNEPRSQHSRQRFLFWSSDERAPVLKRMLKSVERSVALVLGVKARQSN